MADSHPSIAAESSKKANHLIHEKSPYLLQHAYNPVDWYPWGEAAFQKARKENKPLFLSIGYATCHWCHVMERESFTDPAIAQKLNKSFVSIKVDREERPDVDDIYMTAAHAGGWGGGWPLSLWLTPDLKPFYGGTYFPPRAKWGRPGFSEILDRIAHQWNTHSADLTENAGRLAHRLDELVKIRGAREKLSAEWLKKAYASYASQFQPGKGGFSGAPKFPMPVNQNFLLRYFARSGEQKALEMAHTTLTEMAKGGIHDQVGGGFHRYSTDAIWHIPHFEKMLYDNAQLAVNFLEAYQATGDEEMARVAQETLDYVLRDMTHPAGGFYSAEDADSLPPEEAGKAPSDESHPRKAEGAFYLWRKAEIDRLLPPAQADLFRYRYGVKDGGNAESDPRGEFVGKNILFTAQSLQETARHFKRSQRETRDLLTQARARLLQERARRPRPALDDKILTSWNGLMISAFARGRQVLHDKRDKDAAVKAARFIYEKLYDSKENLLYHRWREGERAIAGMATDYSFLIQGLIDLYETTFDLKWLDWAVALSDKQIELFYDPGKGAFYTTAAHHDKNLLARVMVASDNVEPNASSVAALNLLRLSQLTGRDDYEEKARETLERFGEQMARSPRSLPQMLVAVDFALSKPKQVIIAGSPRDTGTIHMLNALHHRFIPVKIVMVVGEEGIRERLSKNLPFLKGVKQINGKPTAYVCENLTCKLPTTSLKKFIKILR